MASPTESVRPNETSSAESETSRGATRRRGKQTATNPAGKGSADIILVGFGAFAQQALVPVLQSLRENGAVVIRAIVDPDAGMRDCGREHFPEAAASASLDSVVAPPDGLAIISSPTRFHAAQSSAALKRGWHVLCAAPLAPTPREAAQMIAAARQHERCLAVDLPARFLPAAHYLRTLCRDHLLGPPIRFVIHEGAPPASTPQLPSPEKLELPDGVLAELGTRPLDLLTWLFGAGAVRNYADDAMGGVEANGSIELSFNEGTTGTIHLSRDWPTEQAYTLVFERGLVRWDGASPASVTLQLASAPYAVQGQLAPALSARGPVPDENLPATIADARKLELEHILGAISRRESLQVPAAEGLPSLILIEECYARRRPLSQPWLTQPEAAQARALAPPVALRRP